MTLDLGSDEIPVKQWFKTDYIPGSGQRAGGMWFLCGPRTPLVPVP